MSNNEVADTLRETIFHALEWLETQDWYNDRRKSFNRKEYILGIISRIGEDSFGK